MRKKQLTLGYHVLYKMPSATLSCNQYKIRCTFDSNHNDKRYCFVALVCLTDFSYQKILMSCVLATLFFL